MKYELSEVAPILIGTLAGFVIAVVIAWIMFRRLSELVRREAQNENRTEMALLSERFSSVTNDLIRNRAELSESQAEVTGLRDQLNALRDDRARLEKRAGRVRTLEDQLTEQASQLNVRAEDVTRLTGQLAERTQAVESTTNRLAELERERSSDRESLRVLRAQVQEETNRAATLTEQAARLPELGKALEGASTEREQFIWEIAQLRQQRGSAEATLEANSSQITRLERESSELTTRRDELLREQQILRTQVAELTVTLDGERKQGAEKLALLAEAEQKFSASFESLANRIFEEKSQRFTDQNKANMGQILEPLRSKIQEFQAKVEEVYVQEGKDRSALTQQVKQLMGLNQQLSQEANDLTSALKGSSKAQGNWGEMVLERVLEDCGLRKDLDYLMRPTYTREDGSRVQPDSVVHLPENRNLVLDAKVSLLAYDEYASSRDEDTRALAIQRHLASVRGHISGLSASNYQLIEALKSLDFVIMFVPIEPAFILAVANDGRLWQDAWQKNILLVSPSSLLFVVRIVANLWRQEIQKRNVQDIVKRGADLYDKLVGFVEDLRAIGQRLGQARESYDSAYAKLYMGKGNVIRRAEMLKDLGVKPSKSLPAELIEAATEEPMLAVAPDTNEQIR